MIIAVNFPIQAIGKKKPEKKNQGFNGIRTRDLRIASALLYQLSYEATHWAQLVEQRTGNAEVMGSNPIEALIFFRLLLSNCLNWKIYCDDHSSLTNKILLSLYSKKQ